MLESENTPSKLFVDADAAVAQGELDKAIELFREVARRAPEDSAALTRAGHLLLRRDRVLEARHVLDQAIIRHRDNATAWFLMAEVAEHAKDIDGASEAFNQVIRLRPDLALAHSRLGRLTQDRGAVAASIPPFREAVRLEPGNPRHHSDLAGALYDARMTEEAIPCFKRYILLSPENADGRYNIAVTLPLLGAREAGLRDFRRTVVLNPLSGAAWTRIGRLNRRLNPDANTVASDRRAIILEPHDHEPILRRAATATNRGEAIHLRRRVSVLAPDNQGSLVRLGELLLEEGKPFETMALLKPLVEAPRAPEAAVEVYRNASLVAGEPVPVWCLSAYQRWLEAYETSERISGTTARLDGPTISVVMPVCDPPVDFLLQAINSVVSQSYPCWQLCIADDASHDPEVRHVLMAATKDPRIRVIFRGERGHISAASNTALAEATGDFVCFLDHDDLLARDALSIVADTLVRNPSLGMVYSDEDKIDEKGVRFDPHFKPDWNLDLLLSQNYLCHLMVIRRALVDDIGGFTRGLEGSQDHDLALRVGEILRPGQIWHIRRVLYHWRAAPGSTALGTEAKPYTVEATRKTLQAYHDRAEDGAVVRTQPNGWRTTRPLPAQAPLISVIVPTRDRLGLLRRCIDGLLRGTRYPSLEIIVVDNGSQEPRCLEYLDQLRRSGDAVVLDGAGDFNFSDLNNQAVEVARGQLLCFLNNDVEPLAPDWLEEMASHALRPEIGVVGAKLLYPDRRVQHGGIVLCGDNVARHLHVGLDETAHGYWGRAAAVQSLAAVTGACMVVRREVYDTIDGFDEAWPVNFGDIDFCLRAGAAGYRTLWTPHAVLLHHESASRGTFFTKAKQIEYEASRRAMVSRWGPVLTSDRHYNPNLSIDVEDEPFDLAFPPRELTWDG
jgi:O-antigen biosynthesis protein